MTAASPPPPGVRVVRDFVSPADEAALLAALLDGGPRAVPASAWTRLAGGRRVAHFGRGFDYATRGVAAVPAPPVPPGVLADAVAAAAAEAGLVGGGASASATCAAAAAAAAASASFQVTANDYATPGSGIHWHCDSHGPFGPALAVLTLGSGAALELRQAVEREEQEEEEAEGGRRGGDAPPAFRRAAVWLPPRSLLVLDGEARHGWEHAIAPRKTDPAFLVHGGGGGGEEPSRPIPRGRRVSLTVRTVRPASARPCACAFPALCDDQGGGSGPTRDAAVAAARAAAAAAAADPADLAAAEAAGRAGLAAAAAAAPAAAASHAAASPAADAAAAAVEAALVGAVYDRIAPHFSGTRVALWPQVVSFVRARGPAALILDVGCGNGKYLALARPAGGCAALAAEPCPALAAAAAAAGPPGRRGSVVIGDGLAPTWRTGVADGVLCVAVVHHVATPARRARLIARCARALAPGGAALITAWARPDAQPTGKDATRAQRWRPLPGGGPGDFLVPWHEPPGWDRTRPTTAAWPPAEGGGARAAPPPPPAKKSAAATSLPPAAKPIRGAGPGGSLTPAQRAEQSAADRARQPPPAAWRFYHCYTGQELSEEAAAGAALATAEAGRAGEAGVAYVAGEAFLDRGNWCVEVARVS